MPETIYVFLYFAMLLLRVISFMMLLRAVFSWIGIGEDGKFSRIVYVMTEPVIVPFRTLFYKKNWFSDTPIDMSFMFAIIAIMILQMLIGALI